MTKEVKKLNVLRRGRAFKVKRKAFFTLFEDVLFKEIKPTFLEGESPALKQMHHMKKYFIVFYSFLDGGGKI